MRNAPLDVHNTTAEGSHVNQQVQDFLLLLEGQFFPDILPFFPGNSFMIHRKIRFKMTDVPAEGSFGWLVQLLFQQPLLFVQLCNPKVDIIHQNLIGVGNPGKKAADFGFDLLKLLAGFCLSG